MPEILPNIIDSLEEAVCCQNIELQCSTSECLAWVWVDTANGLGLCGMPPCNQEYIRRQMFLESTKVVD